jgi:hypothetical protein
LSRVPTPRRPAVHAALIASAALLAGCGGTALLGDKHTPDRHAPHVQPVVVSPAEKLMLPALATKNTTRIDGVDPVADAADVALEVFPSVIPGTHPTAVVLAPASDWQASLAASALMAAPIHAPLLFSQSTALPAVSRQALAMLAPTGASQAGDAQVIRVGDVAAPAGLHAVTIPGSDPYALAAAIDRFIAQVDGRTSINVVVASGTDPAYAMPAAGWAAESGEPILYVDGATIPAATRQALLAHQKPHIYVLGPPAVIPAATLRALRHYGTVKRVGGADPPANSVAFAGYRDPPCAYAQPCAHVPGTFGWAIDSPGHGFILINDARTLDAAAAAALSASGDYGPQLLTDNPTTLPKSVLNYFLNFQPGYNQEGPTAAVYNRGWVVGDERAVSLRMQAELDEIFAVVPEK